MYINYIKNTFNFLCFSFQLFSVVQLLRNFAYNLVSNIILYHIGQPTKIGSCLFFFIFCLNLVTFRIYVTCHSTNEVYRE